MNSNTGCVENGFIVDLTNSKKISEMIYELSRILDMPEAQGKHVCIKFGDNNLSSSHLISVRALVESMDSAIEFISTTSEVTKENAIGLGIEVSEIENELPIPEFGAPTEASTELEDSNVVKPEVEQALDRIFGDAAFEESSEVEEIKENLPSENMAELEKELEEYLKKAKETEKLPTLYIQRNVRSGQSIKSEGNLFIVGDVNAGAEVIAKGDITVWGVLSGIAHAGCEGDSYAKIRALKMNAIQLRIAEIFARRPDSVNIPYVQKTDSYTPEEARVFRKQILIHKIHEN